MMLSLPESRLRAFGIHLALSGVIFLVFLAILYFVWFPGVFIHFGGFEGTKIMAGVDLVLGPLLTLIIYNPKKAKHLIKLDLVIITMFQLGCLSAGAWLVYQQRPMLQVVGLKSVAILTFSEIKEKSIEISNIKSNRLFYPKLVWLDLPNDKQEFEKIKITHDLLGQSIFERTDLYQETNQLTKEQLGWRLLQLPKNDQCTQALVESVHYQSETLCFSESYGIYSSP